jgi:hypothetical protein
MPDWNRQQCKYHDCVADLPQDTFYYNFANHIKNDICAGHSRMQEEAELSLGESDWKR